MVEHKNSRNPLLPADCRFPDCEARVMPDGGLYLYGSLDGSAEHFCSDVYRVVSTKDMASWKVSDISFSAKQAAWASENGAKSRSSLFGVKCFDDLPAHIKEQIPESARNTPIKQIIAAVDANMRQSLPKETLLYAPDAIEHGGKYYLYMCLSDDSEGVAVSDNPEGPFADAQKLPVSGIDPAVFVDDDGQGYYYWGQFNANAVKLNPDMVTLDMSSVVSGIVTEREHHFHEGSSMRKRGDTYYYIFADTSRGKPTSLGYATSKSPLGPFTYQGVIIDNDGCDPKTWNNHGSIEEFNGQWYVFYHRSSENSERMRRVCCEPIFFDERGLIAEVKMTSQGAGQPFGLGETIEGYRACELRGGVYISGSGLVNIKDGDKAVLRYARWTQKVVKAEFQANGGGTVRAYLNGELVGEARIEDGRVVSSNVSAEPGAGELALEFTDTKALTIESVTFYGDRE